jgi:hypothetical protein
MRRSTRGAAVVAVAGLVALVLAGCGTGRDAPTSLDLPSVPGVNLSADDGSVLLRNANVVFSLDGYPAGGQAPVELWLVNTTQETIRLVEVTAGQATAVTFDELTLAPASAVPTTLEATGLNRRVDFSEPLTLTLVFDNGAEISAVVPMAPPMDDHLPREPMTFEEPED